MPLPSELFGAAWWISPSISNYNTWDGLGFSKQGSSARGAPPSRHRAWVARKPLPHHQSSSSCAMGVGCGSHLGCPYPEQCREARARCALMVAAADQTSIDAGSWVLSGVALLEPPPPFHSFATPQSPAPQEMQHSSLLDLRWVVELFLGHVKEMDTYGHLPGNEKEAGQRRKQQCGAPSRCRGESKTKTQSKEQRERKGQRSRCRGRNPGPASILGEKGAEKATPFSSGPCKQICRATFWPRTVETFGLQLLWTGTFCTFSFWPFRSAHGSYRSCDRLSPYASALPRSLERREPW